MAAPLLTSDVASRFDPVAFSRCIEDARAGSSTAMGQLLELCNAYLMLVANRELDRRLRAKISPSDVVQETLLEAERDFIQFHGQNEAELLAWLHRLLLNNVADATRKYRNTAKRSITREVSLDAATSDPGLSEQLVDAGRSPSSDAAGREESQRVLVAIARLPDSYRQVISLRHVDGCKFAEIARRMNRSVQAVHNLWTRAILRLQSELDACDEAGRED